MSDSSICNHCGRPAGSVFVHGHYQCLGCHSIQVPCCEGSAACVVPFQNNAGQPPKTDPA